MDASISEKGAWEWSSVVAKLLRALELVPPTPPPLSAS
jgi:hypothetical protein